MTYILGLIGLVASIWLVSDSTPGSFWFVWGVVFIVLNLGLMIRGEQS